MIHSCTRWLFVCLALCGCAVMAAKCGAAEQVRVGSKAFTESVILGEIATQLSRDAGVDTLHQSQLGGTRVPKGARVLVLMGSANRDEAHFPDPDRFDLERPGPQNLPFGHGIHFCLGSQLARLEARLAVEALLARFSRLTPGDGPVRWNASLIVRGPAKLPLVAHPA